MFQSFEILESSKDNLELGRELMGIEITDDELLSMEPELLVRLQQYLKEYRSSRSAMAAKETNAALLPDPVDPETKELKILSNWSLSGATFEEVEDIKGDYLGTRVTQDNVTYIARHWRMTDEVKKILAKAAGLGFGCFWRHNHPQDSYLEGNEKYLKGCHHIGCSRTHNSPWLFVLGAESLSRRLGVQVVKEITFNRVYHQFMDTALERAAAPMHQTYDNLVPGTYKIQKGAGRCYTTHPADFQQLIEYLSEQITQ